MRLTLGKKLPLGFGAILALMVLSGTAAILKIREMRALQEYLADNRMPTLDAGRCLQRDILPSGKKARQAILAGNQNAAGHAAGAH
jgi:CHASE3 domain sensor protein